MIKLFACLGSGNCLKPWLAMHQLGIPFEMSLIDVLSGEQKSPEYLSINPLGVVPYMITSDGQGIGESNAMLWYLAEGTDLMPHSRADRAEALQWMFFEQSKLEPFISPARFMTTIAPHLGADRQDDILRWQTAAKPGLARLNVHLSDRQFVLSQGYSIADIALFGYVHVLDEAGLIMSDYPMVERWCAEINQTKAFRPLQDLGKQTDKAA